MSETLEQLLDSFAQSTKLVLSQPGAKPELSVTGKFDVFISAALDACTTGSFDVSQQVNAQDIGVPDFRISRGQELLGWIEFKAVIGKDLQALTGHDQKQKQRFVAGLHNLILTNGWEWELFQNGRRVKRVLFDKRMFTDDLLFPLEPRVLEDLRNLLFAFGESSLAPYSRVDDAVGALALRAKALKLALIELGPANAGNHLNQLRQDFEALLYRNGQPFTWERFVDSYVQIAAFGALLWRLETNGQVSLSHQVALKPGIHPLLSQCLAILWAPQSQVAMLRPLLEELCRTINLIDPRLFVVPPKLDGKRKYVADPIVHAYEPFFQKYDQAAREAAGVYYTPVEIVQQIVSGVDAILRTTLGRSDGILDDEARFLDPAAGTGTFLLGLANEVMNAAARAGLPTDQVVHEVLTKRTAAFELFPGPYTIAHQRLEALLESMGTPATARLPVYLADTLAAPESGLLPLSGFGPVGDEIVEERQRADWVKTGEKILVILGNPPYERVRIENGGWDKFTAALMQQVVDATPIERRSDLKSATDLYVAFWAWALWALRSPEDRIETVQKPTIDTSRNHGMVAFITNRTWVLGPSLVGLRALVRSGVREVWICDLGGDARGGSGARSFAGGDANVFGIQTGVAIVWLVFDREFSGDPTLRYQRIFGPKAQKLVALAEPFDAARFREIQSDDLFVPIDWPSSLDAAPRTQDLFQAEPFTGIQSARDSRAYSPWAVDRGGVYAETRSKRSEKPVRHGSLGLWADLSPTRRTSEWQTADAKRRKRHTPEPADLKEKLVRPALYRPLDDRFVYDDPSWLDWYRSDLHDVYELGEIPTLITLPRDFGAGPLAIHTNKLAEQHAFKGKAGGKGVFPLWLPAHGRPDDGFRIVDGRLCNLAEATLKWAYEIFDHADAPPLGAYHYILAILSAPSYAERYWRELEVTSPRVPLTADKSFAREAAELGSRLVAAWENRIPPVGIAWGGQGIGALGKASFHSGAIKFASGRTLTGMTLEAWEFEVSGYHVAAEWLAAREEWTATMPEAQKVQRMVAALNELCTLKAPLDALFDRLIG